MLGEEELAVWAEALHEHLDEDARGLGRGVVVGRKVVGEEQRKRVERRSICRVFICIKYI